MNNLLTILATTPIDPIEGGGSDFNGSVIGVINAVVGALALVAVVVVVMGGVRYMTSSGEAGKVKSAKDTILYGLIGLAVCALAAALVNFVIANIIK